MSNDRDARARFERDSPIAVLCFEKKRGEDLCLGIVEMATEVTSECVFWQKIRVITRVEHSVVH